MFCKKSPVMSQDFPNHVRPPLGGNTKDPGGVIANHQQSWWY